MEVAVFDSPSPEDSNTGLGFILPSTVLDIFPVLFIQQSITHEGNDDEM